MNVESLLLYPPPSLHPPPSRHASRLTTVSVTLSTTISEHAVLDYDFVPHFGERALGAVLLPQAKIPLSVV